MPEKTAIDLDGSGLDLALETLRILDVLLRVQVPTRGARSNGTKRLLLKKKETKNGIKNAKKSGGKHTCILAPTLQCPIALPPHWHGKNKGEYTNGDEYSKELWALGRGRGSCGYKL